MTDETLHGRIQVLLELTKAADAAHPQALAKRRAAMRQFKALYENALLS